MFGCPEQSMRAPEPVPDLRSSENAAPRRLKLILSYAVAAACLAWVLSNARPDELLESLRQLNWGFVALAIAADGANYFLQGFRWSLLLRPVARVKPLRAIQGIYVALFTNNVLPMRFGDLARAYLIAKRYSRNFSDVIPSIVVEHMSDGIWLALGIALATPSLPLPRAFQRGAQIFGFGVILLAAGFFYAVVRKQKDSAGWKEYSGSDRMRKIGRIIGRLALGMRKIGFSSRFFWGLALTLASLIFQALALWFGAVAYRIPLTPWSAAVVLLIIRVGVVIPNAPANLGAYQFFAALGLELMGVSRSVATGFSLVLFLILTTPTCIAGFFVLSHSGITLLRLNHEARVMAKAV